MAPLSLLGIGDGQHQSELYACSHHATLESLDAFVSHSWRDGPAACFDALAQWCADFETLHKREPVLWFDRCCVSAGTLHSALACLPIFVASARKFVMLCGP